MIEPRQTHRPVSAVRLGVVGFGGAVTVGLPATFPPGGGRTGLDGVAAEPIHSTMDAHRGVYEALAIPSNGYILIPLLLIACVWFATQGAWWRAVTMLVAPEFVVALNTWVLKPLWDRPLHDYLAYPSGHTVHLVAIATAFVLLIDSVRARLVALAAAAVALPAAAIGMIGLDYHSATDIIGGAAAAVALTTALCWAAYAAFDVPHPVAG